MSEQGYKDLHQYPEMAGAKPDRMRCVVPYCKCTTSRFKPPAQWICRKHWLQVPRYMRLRKNRLARAYRRRFGHRCWFEMRKGSADRRYAFRLTVVYNQAWDACVRWAVERATGIS